MFTLTTPDGLTLIAGVRGPARHPSGQTTSSAPTGTATRSRSSSTPVMNEMLEDLHAIQAGEIPGGYSVTQTT